VGGPAVHRLGRAQRRGPVEKSLDDRLVGAGAPASPASFEPELSLNEDPASACPSAPSCLSIAFLDWG
jgi:hypothetical protein